MQTLPAPASAPAPLPALPAERFRLSLDEGGGGRGGGGGLKRLLALLYRFRWVLPLPLAAGIAAGIVASRQVRPEYVARSTIWVDADRATAGLERSGPLRAADLLQSKAWVELMRSYAVLDPVVRSERLYLVYTTPADSVLFRGFGLAERFRPGEYRLNAEGGTFRLSTPGGATVERGRLGGPVGASVGFEWRPDVAALRKAGSVDFTVVTPRDAAVRLSNQLVTQMAENGNFLRLELEGTDPERIASTLNTLTSRYVDVAGELKRARLKELEGILSEQLQYAAAALQREESALQGFRVRTITLPTDRGSPVTPGLEVTQDPVYNNFFALNMEREQIQRDRDALARAVSPDGASIGALEAIPSVQRSSALAQTLAELTARRAELRAMSAQFTDLYAPLQRAREQVQTLERQTLPALAGRLDAELAGRQQAIDGLIQSASVQLRDIPPRAFEEARLRRRVAISEELYKLLSSATRRRAWPP